MQSRKFQFLNSNAYKKTTMPSLYVLDASGYLYRSYFAIHNLTNDRGESTNALYGFIRSVKKLCNDFHPDHLVAVFDGPSGIEKRKNIYPAYKAQRAKMADDLRHQIQWAQEFCDIYGIPKLVIPRVEADDTMGSVAKWAGNQGTSVYLCTGDKDLCQLVTENINILNTHKENLILGPKEVEQVYGVPPRQIVDFLAITGDSSDNVPGLSGFGPKGAVALLQQFGSLDEILAHPESLSGKKKQETIVQEAPLARLSRELVTLDTDLDIPKDLFFYQLKQQNTRDLKTFYTHMNFYTLLRELEGEGVKEEVSCELVDDSEALEALVAALSQEKEICFDTETTHWHPLKAELVGIGFCISASRAWYVPANGKLGLHAVLKALSPLFANPSIGFYGHNVKYDYHVLTNEGISIKKICFDTILASYLLQSHERLHSLDHLALKHFGQVKTPISDLIGKGKQAITMRDVPIEKVCAYCCEDVICTYRLKQLLEKELEERALTKLFVDLELPLLPVLARMERRGVFLDVPVLEKMAVDVHDTIHQLEQEIYRMAGASFNINSPKQLGEILFQKLNIPFVKKTTTGYSTSAAILDKLKGEYPIAAKVLEYRQVEKLRSTYIEALPQEVNTKTKRIHPTFNQSVAATGRLSCQDPNLQNIPIRTEIGRRIREAFRPEKEEWSYLSADYSQIELRLLAHFSEDPKLIAAFSNHVDIHTDTAATLLNIPLDQVTKEQRNTAKAINFGIIYGQQAFGLSQGLNISFEEAQSFIERYFARYRHVRDFIESCKNQARKTGKAVTLFGRERIIPEICSKNPQIRAAAERLAVNTPLQGTNADLIKSAMLTIDKKIQEEQKLGYMLLQIHDELIFELPSSEILSFQSLVREEMEHVHSFKVPLVVNISIGKNWKECYN